MKNMKSIMESFQRFLEEKKEKEPGKKTELSQDELLFQFEKGFKDMVQTISSQLGGEWIKVSR